LGDAAGTDFWSGAPQIPLGDALRDAAGNALRLNNPTKPSSTPSYNIKLCSNRDNQNFLKKILWCQSLLVYVDLHYKAVIQSVRTRTNSARAGVIWKSTCGVCGDRGMQAHLMVRGGINTE
jgi:hypothetical protein